MQFESHVDVRRPIGEVFDFVADGDNLPRWLGENMQLLTPGTLKVGSEFRELTKVGFWTVETRCHITAVEPERVLTYKASSRFLSYEGEVRLDRVPDGTRVTLRGHGQLQGPFRVLEPLLNHEARRNVAAEVLRLKQQVEARAAGACC